MQRTSTTQAYDNDQREVLPINLGGTGVTNANDAPQALGGVNTNLKDHPNGLATLERNSKIPNHQLDYIPGVEMPSIGGSNIVYTYTTPIFTITNFDSQTTYNINTNHGSVSRNGDEITYYAPATPCVDVLQVNNNIIGINVLASSHEKPTISFPGADQLNIAIHPVIQLYSIVWIGYEDEPGAIEWEITEQGQAPVIETKVDRQLHYTPSYALKLSTAYSVRARVSGILTGAGEWSDSISFTTTDIVLPITEVAKLHAFPETGFTNSFGRYNITVSPDAQVIVTSDPDFYFDLPEPARKPGRVFIYSYENDVWVQNAIDSGIVDDGIFGAGIHNFGFGVALSADKQRILVLSTYNPDNPITSLTNDPIGDIRIYETVTPNDYSAMTLIAHHPGATMGIQKLWQGLSAGFATTPNFETIAFGLQYDADDAITMYPTIRILNFDGVDTITLKTEIQTTTIDSDPDNTKDWIGERISLSTDGLVLLTHTSRLLVSHSSGGIYIYEYANDAWSQTDVITPDNDPLAAETFFGYPVQISYTGTKIATFSNTISDNTGHVYLFEKINNVWTKTKKLDLPEMQESQLGGEAYDFRFNQTGTLLLMSSPWQSTPVSGLVNGSWDNTGVCYLFDIAGTEITTLNTYIASDASNGLDGEQFGESIAFTPDGTGVVITAPWRSWEGTTQRDGTIYVYK